MSSAIIVTPAISDPLLTRVPLEHETTIYPRGFPAKILSNSVVTLEAAVCTWGAYKRIYNHPALEIRLALSESDSPACIEPPAFRSDCHLMSIVADRENFASLDLKAGFAFGWVTVATASNQQYFRRYFVDAIIESLLNGTRIASL